MRLTSIGLPPYRVFTLEEIEDATNNFDPSNLMGEGSQGKVIDMFFFFTRLLIIKFIWFFKHFSLIFCRYIKVGFQMVLLLW